MMSKNVYNSKKATNQCTPNKAQRRPGEKDPSPPKPFKLSSGSGK